jgi:hypothetical protein
MTLAHRHKIHIPAPVKRILHFNKSAWLLGSGARFVAGYINGNPRDWDVVFTDIGEWNLFISDLKDKGTPFRLNSFGGFKITFPDCEMDVWCDNLQSVLLRPFNSHAYNMFGNMMWIKEKHE